MPTRLARPALPPLSLEPLTNLCENDSLNRKKHNELLSPSPRAAHISLDARFPTTPTPRKANSRKSTCLKLGQALGPTSRLHQQYRVEPDATKNDSPTTPPSARLVDKSTRRHALIRLEHDEADFLVARTSASPNEKRFNTGVLSPSVVKARELREVSCERRTGRRAAAWRAKLHLTGK